MQLKGLSKYDVHFTDDDRVMVYSKFYKSYITPRHINGSDKWELSTDFGKLKHVTEGQLRFMRNHLDVSADAISCRTVGIKFLKNGTVCNLYGGGESESVLCSKV